MMLGMWAPGRAGEMDRYWSAFTLPRHHTYAGAYLIAEAKQAVADIKALHKPREQYRHMVVGLTLTYPGEAHITSASDPEATVLVNPEFLLVALTPTMRCRIRWEPGGKTICVVVQKDTLMPTRCWIALCAH